MEQDKVQDIIERVTEIVRMQHPITTNPWVCVDSREETNEKVIEPSDSEPTPKPPETQTNSPPSET